MNKREVMFYLLNLLYGSMMILYSQIPSYIIAGISFIFYLYNYIILSKKYSKTIALFYNSILFLPVSFVSIIGTDYAAFPITWFSISIILLTIVAGLTNNLKRNYGLLFLLYILIFIISLFSTNSYISALSQFFTISLCLFSFQIGEMLKKSYSDTIINKGIDFYMLSCLSCSFQILIQRYFILRTGTIIGHYSIMGGNRIAYAGLMSDYSFASLYLVTACLVLLLLYIHYKKISFHKFVFFFSVFTLLSILTSARTGFFSLIIAIMFFMARNFNKKNAGRIFLIIVFGMAAIPFALHFMSSLRTLDNFLDGSGRIEIMQKAFSIINTKPLLGVGFGIENLRTNYNMMLPHNYFVQYLLQFGIIGTITITINFIIFYYQNKKNNILMWLFVLCFIGSMLIPDIFSSRFLTIIIILIMINQGGVKFNENKKEKM